MTTLTHAARRASVRRPLSLMSLFALMRSRRALAVLDDTALRDIGLSRTAAAREAQRPVWDVPAHWRR